MLEDLRMRWRSLFRRGAMESELSEELRFHFEQHVEKLVRSGVPIAEARRRARLEIGTRDQIREEFRDASGVRFFETLIQDIRFAFRMLRKSPAFAVVAVLTLALGIGANTTIFSLIDAVMLRSLPVRDPNQLVIMQWRARQISFDGEYSSFGDCGESGISGASGCSFPLPILRQLSSQKNVFSGVTAFAGPAALDLSGNGPATIAGGEIVSGDYFSTLGVTAVIGRTLGPSDDSPSASPAAVLSYAYWQSAFGGSRSVVGRTILLNSVPFTIVGVAEPSFTNLSPGKSQDLWVTIEMVPRLNIDWGQKIHGMTNWWLAVLARLKPDVPLAQAQAAASLVFQQQVLNDRKTFSKVSEPKILLTRAQEGLVGKRGQISKMLYVLLCAVGIILLIACANVGGLLLSRSGARQKEIAVRLALGAGRAKIVRQLLTESILLSSIGGLLGIIFAYWGVKAVTTMIAGSDAHFPYTVAPDWRVLAFALGVGFLTGIFFGLGPALRATRVDLTPALKESASAIPGNAARNPRFHLGSALVVAQVALSVVVLAGAGLLVRTLKNLRDVDPGFDTRNILLFAVNPTLLGYDDAQMQNLYAELRRRFSALPGVNSVSNSSEALLDGSQWVEAVHFVEHPEKGGFDTDMLAAGAQFFTTMRIPLLEGRIFTPVDFEEAAQASGATTSAPQENEESPGTSANRSAQPLTAPVSVLVNRAFVQRYYRNENPLGKRMWHGGGNSGSSGGAFGGHYNLSKLWQIVGVVGDTKYDALRKTIKPMVYVPFTSGGCYFEVRTAGDARALVPAVRSAANKIDSKLPLTHMRTQTQAIDNQLSQERLIAQLSGFFAMLALALSCIGLYGLLSYEVSRRTREIGIRMALGAQRREVLRLVVGRGILLAVAGAVIGIGAAAGATRFLASMLYGVRAGDVPTFVMVITLLLIVALAACWIPARRALRVDPMVALRYE